MTKKNVLLTVSGVAAGCLLMAAAQPSDRRCIGVSAVPVGTTGQVAVLRVFDDGSVDYVTVKDLSVPTGNTVDPAWLRREKK